MNNTLNNYVWMVDTIRRYGRITQAELSRLWSRTTMSGGRPMPRRTFNN